MILALGNGTQEQELREELRLLPENAFEILTSMWKSEYPSYDFEEEFPNSTEMSEEEHQKWLQTLDLEDYDSLDKDLK